MDKKILSSLSKKARRKRKNKELKAINYFLESKRGIFQKNRYKGNIRFSKGHTEAANVAKIWIILII